MFLLPMIGLHAFQLGIIGWRKFRGQLNRTRTQDKHVVLLRINYTVHISLQVFFASWRSLCHSSKTLNHILVLVLFNVFFVHVMTSPPFKFFLQHRKPSALVILVSVVKFHINFGKFWENSGVFLKMDSRADDVTPWCWRGMLSLLWLAASLFSRIWLVEDNCKLSMFS